MGLRELGGFLLILGGLLTFIGLILLLFPRGLSWLGHLPGDLRFDIGERGRVYIPLVTSLLLSVVLSVLLTLLLQLPRLFRH